MFGISHYHFNAMMFSDFDEEVPSALEFGERIRHDSLALNSQMMSNYKTKHQDFRKIFRDTEAENSSLLADYACAIYAGTPKILQQGRIYITFEYICFICKIFNEIKICLHFCDVVDITKEKTALVFPNAIQIQIRDSTKYFFASFASRDKAFQFIERIWIERQTNAAYVAAVFWDRVRENYGPELGLTMDDPQFEDSKASQFNAVFKKAIPADAAGRDSSQESVYESIEEVTSAAESAVDEVSSSDQSAGPVARIRASTVAKCSRPNGKRHSTSQLEKKVVSDSEIQFTLQYRKISRDMLNGFNNISTSIRKPQSSSQRAAHVTDSPSASPQTSPDKQQLQEIVMLEPAECGSEHEHFDNSSLDCEVGLPVGLVWRLIFTDTAFYRALCCMRLVTDITQAAWPSLPTLNDSQQDRATGPRCRTIYYTANLKNRIGPKKSPTVETQTILRDSQDEYTYFMQSKIRTMDVPYSDSFHIVIRYCLLYINPSRTRIKSSFKVVYDKSIFFPTKSIIESTVKNGCMEYCKDMKSALLNEAEQLQVASTEPGALANAMRLDCAAAGAAIGGRMGKQQSSAANERPSCIIEDRYQAGEQDDSLSGRVGTVSSVGTKASKPYFVEQQELESNSISWKMMVAVCFVALFALYVVKEFYIVSSNDLSSPNSQPQSVINPLNPPSNSHSPHSSPIDAASINEIIQLIKQVKQAVDMLRDNLARLNNTCIQGN